VLQEQPPVCVSQPHIAQAILAEARATDQLLLFLCKLENLQTGAFSEVRQKICPGPELSVLTSLADNQSFMRRPPRLRMQVSEGPPRKRWALFLFRSRSQSEMAYPFFTIGHSTRTVSQFVDLLQASQIEFVVDVRHIPHSRTNPQFNRETLAEELATVQIWVRLADCETGQESILRPTFSGTTSVSETTRITQ